MSKEPEKHNLITAAKWLRECGLYFDSLAHIALKKKEDEAFLDYTSNAEQAKEIAELLEDLDISAKIGEVLEDIVNREVKSRPNGKENDH